MTLKNLIMTDKNCSNKNTLKLQKGDYLPVLTSKNNTVVEDLKKKGDKLKKDQYKTVSFNSTAVVDLNDQKVADF